MEVRSENQVPDSPRVTRRRPPVDPEKEKRVAALLLNLDTPGAPPLSQAELMDLYESSFRHVSEGEVVRGKVIKILENEIVIDIGYKSEGIVPAAEFRNPDGSMRCAVGEEVEVLLEKVEDGEGYVVLSHDKAEKIKVWERIENAYKDSLAIKGRIMERIKGGLSVDVGVRAFLPGSLVDVRPVRDLESLIGKEFEMKVIKVNRRRGNIVLSRKSILEEVNKKRKTETLKVLEEGKVMIGVVKNITDYGVFIDLGGIDGLLHITDMSWGRVAHPSEMFKIGDEVEVIVLKFDPQSERVSLGFKQKSSDPWEYAPQRYPVSTRVKGKVVSLANYGAFVELEEGIEGLIHISEMSWTKKVKHPSQVVTLGDWVDVMVLDIDPGNRRISLGLKQTEPNPWDSIARRYEIGQVIRGKVRNLTDFGAFVEVEEGIDGLIHISDLSWNKRINHPSEILKKGDEVDAVILSIEPEAQRLSLGIKQLTSSAWDEYTKMHNLGDVVTGKVTKTADFGIFVELAEGVEGLVHISELSNERVEKAEDLFTAGDELRVKIIKINTQDKKIGLSVKEASADQEREETASYRSSPGSSSVTLGDLAGDLFRRSGTKPASSSTDEVATSEEHGDGGES